MPSISRFTGKVISDIDHVKQSIADILTTPKGSRVMRRDYGSDIYIYRDWPINKTTIAHIYEATARAIDIWEPRVKLSGSKINLASSSDGELVISIDFVYRPDGEKYDSGDIFL